MPLHATRNLYHFHRDVRSATAGLDEIGLEVIDYAARWGFLSLFQFFRRLRTVCGIRDSDSEE